jgi:hypothetical protein
VGFAHLLDTYGHSVPRSESIFADFLLAQPVFDLEACHALELALIVRHDDHI